MFGIRLIKRRPGRPSLTTRNLQWLAERSKRSSPIAQANLLTVLSKRAERVAFDQALRTANEVILEVKGGEGGDDSKLFAHNLFAALSKYAIRHGLLVEVVSNVPGHICATVRGKRVWQLLKPEMGKHCVQRVPPTEQRGRRHTSYLAVAVLPIINFAMKSLPESEIEIKTQRGHGPGGQHQNKTDSAVRMTHLPTGIKVLINGRDQRSNRTQALKILTARVRDQEQQQANDSYRQLRQSQLGNVGRGQKIRTYNYIDDRAVDHRNGARSRVRAVIEKGQFELLQS